MVKEHKFGLASWGHVANAEPIETISLEIGIWFLLVVGLNV